MKNVYQVNFYFKSIKFFSLRFDATFPWIQINIFIVSNEYLVDSIKNIKFWHVIEAITSFYSVYHPYENSRKSWTSLAVEGT